MPRLCDGDGRLPPAVEARSRDRSNCAAYTSGLRMSFTACSHKTSGLRPPPFARSMILSAIACLTPSSQSPIRSAVHVISNARPRMRLVSGRDISESRQALDLNLRPLSGQSGHGPLDRADDFRRC